MREVGPPIGLRYFVPAPPLRGVVSSYYLFHADMPQYTDVMRADLPQLRFMVRGSANYLFSDGRVESVPRATLLGPTYEAYRFETRGPLLVLGIGLQPTGWATLIREDASIYANRVVDLEPLFGSIIADMLDTLESIIRPTAMGEAADRLVAKLLSHVPEPSVWFTRLADDWLASALSPEVDALVESVGMSSRQVERLTKRIYGAPPKLLGRKYRALKAAAELSKGIRPWPDVIGDAFSDQSHFIRECRQFVGVTPNKLIAETPLVTRLSLERRRALLSLPELTKIT